MRRLLVCFLAAAAFAQESELAAAVDLPTAAERKKAALVLAKNKAVSLEGWLGLMRKFGPRGTRGAGKHTVTVPLSIEGKLEQTEITVYVPGSAKPSKPAPLLLTLHGSGGDGRYEWSRWREIADALGMIVLSPSEAVEASGYAFTRRERTSALATLRWARREFNVDENRIHVTGISRGGHLTWDLGLRHPDRFATLSPMIGGPRLDTRNGQNNLRYLENAAHTPIRDLQGDGDDPRMLFNLRLAFQRLKVFGAKDAELVIFPGMGHAFRMEAVDWKEFFSVRSRDPARPRVVRRSADLREGRAFWVEILAMDRAIKESFMPQVKVAEWNALDDAGKRRYIAAAAEKRTARLEVTRERAGVFSARGTAVRRFRLLLAADMFDPREPLSISWKGRTRTIRARPSKRALLLDFVERFDRTYLPVASVRIP